MVFYRELMQSYPEAKFILTVRDSAEQWHKSQMSTLMGFFAAFYSPSLFATIYRLFLPQTPVDRLNLLLKKHYMYKDLDTNGIKFYNEYNAEIQRLVPKEKLLIFNVKQGWAPLASFLDHEVPKYPFPRINDTMIFQENGAALKRSMDKTVMWNSLKSFSAVAVGLMGVTYALRRVS